jgi:predicted nuclease of predicted toxin-antitoxin system
MSLKLLADHCISREIIDAIRKMGHDVVRLKDVLSPDSPDAVVIAKAKEIDSVLISLNGDFADIITYPPEAYEGIITLQVRNHPEIIPQLIGRLRLYLTSHPDRAFYRGKLLIVEPHRIRVRE